MAKAKELSADSFSPDLVTFLQGLQNHGVSYLVVGGNAVIFHGHIRYTGDFDVFYRNTPENRRALFATLAEFWSGAVPCVAAEEDLAPPGTVIQFGRPPNRIDLLNKIDGVEFEAAWPRREVANMRLAEMQLEIPFLGLEDLLTNKRACGRGRDLNDIEALG